jgi:hypothetical protein
MSMSRQAFSTTRVPAGSSYYFPGLKVCTGESASSLVSQPPLHAGFLISRAIPRTQSF